MGKIVEIEQKRAKIEQNEAKYGKLLDKTAQVYPRYTVATPHIPTGPWLPVTWT